MFCGCSSGQDEAAREQSSKRIAEMNQLQQQIQATDFEISKHLKLRSSAMRAAKESNSFDSNENVARYDAIINELKSKRETLVNKLNVLYKIEQENQSKL
jgi:hypothetical protein